MTQVFEDQSPPREKDPNGVPAHKPGSKLDYGKDPVYQGLFDYFPRACLAVSGVSMYGATKYTWKGWEAVKDGIARYRNAMGRHILKESIEGPWDQDIANDPKYPGRIRHAAQVAWNAMAALELILREEEDNGHQV